jgi:hypothetical protein
MNVVDVNTRDSKAAGTTIQDSIRIGATASTRTDQKSYCVDLSIEAVDTLFAETGFIAKMSSLKMAKQMQMSIIDIIDQRQIEFKAGLTGE